MPLVATFLIKETFSITNRGFVLAGNILTGIVRRNDFIVLKHDGQSTYAQIVGVDFVDRRAQKTAYVGLMISNEDKLQLGAAVLEEVSVGIVSTKEGA